MAIKKSELYSSLWASCDELRGGMDASQYKDDVLVLLFVKYVSDKYAGVPYAPITIPEGASFKDMVALKGKPDIGDQINKKIIGRLANANKLSDMPDFNDPGKLGSGQEIVERLTNLISIFENKSLDFSDAQTSNTTIVYDSTCGSGCRPLRQGRRTPPENGVPAMSKPLSLVTHLGSNLLLNSGSNSIEFDGIRRRSLQQKTKGDQ